MKQLQVIKMALAFFLAMTIAQCFGLQYTASAGIVGLLTIQNTRKETFQICLKRVLSFFLAFICAYVVFLIFGYSAMSFAISIFKFLRSTIMSMAPFCSRNSDLWNPSGS